MPFGMMSLPKGLPPGMTWDKLREVAGATDCDCPIYLSPLHCPFAWNENLYLDFHTLDELAYSIDKLPLAGSPWSAIFERLRLAFSLFVYDRNDEARAHMVDCYMYLFPCLQPGPEDEFVRKYRVAIRFLLDSTWAGLCLVLRKPCYGLDPPLKAFLQRLPRLEDLSKPQQAAVWAMKGCFLWNKEGGRMQSCCRKAIALDPEEAEWRHLLGWKLQGARGEYAPWPDSEEMTSLREAYRLRKTPSTTLRLAASLADGGPRDKTEARKLIDEALKLYPDKAAVYVQAADVMQKMSGRLNPTQLAEVQNWLKRALGLAGESAYLLMKIGSIAKFNGRKNKSGLKMMEKAIRMNPEACNAFLKIDLNQTDDN